MLDQRYTAISFKEFAEQILESESQKTLTAYALDSVLSAMRKEDVAAIDADFLKLWIASMAIEGKKISTCKRYFGKIHSLYNEWSGEAGNGMFAEVLPLFANLQEANVDEANNNLALVKRLLGRSEQSADWQTVCIFLYLLYSPSASLEDVVNLTFSDAKPFCAQVDDIVNSFNSSYGRKYVFELKQGKSRPHEIIQRLTRQLQALLTSVGMRFSTGFSRGSITSLWISAALKCGFDIDIIKACVGVVSPEYSVLSIVKKRDIDDYAREAVACEVADSINNYASRWFVMKLRQGTTVADVKESIAEKLPGRLNSMTLFYPTHVEMHKEGRKRVVEEIPYLPNILFFKTQSNRVKSLFANIGDLAWCFRTSNSPESDYAVISNRQMAIFQQCIGRFTPDIRMGLVDGQQQLEKGRKVRVTGGIMAGYEGEIVDVENEPGRRIFFLSIADNQKAWWTVKVEDVFIQPIA